MIQRQAGVSEDTRPDISIGDRVTVNQPGLTPWQGEVIAIKPGAEAWVVEVRNADSYVWSVPAHRVEVVA